MADMFDVLRASLWTDEDVSLPDWQPVFEEMKQQTVAALPGAWLPSHLNAAPWLVYCRTQQAQWVRVMYAQDQLLQLLEAHDIPCVILKGAAAAMAYPHPTLRSMGDVDFLVKRRDLERTAALLEANGYALEHEKDLSPHHYGYTRDHLCLNCTGAFCSFPKPMKSGCPFLSRGSTPGNGARRRATGFPRSRPCSTGSS